MTQSIYRVAPDGLSRERWDFDVGGSHGCFGVRFTFYGIERRKAKGRFTMAKSDERWDSRDERRYFSGLPRPTAVPADVLDEAWAAVPRTTYIGYFNEDCRL
jgi:hypothetical protein